MEYEDYIIDDTDISVYEDEPKKKPHDDVEALRAEYHSMIEEENIKNESIIEWFDRSVENELEKHRFTDMGGHSPPLQGLSPGLRHPQLVDSTASGIEILNNLQTAPDTELSDAVDKFAKAEAIVAFEGAVRAAEEAAASAPPELAEEAAVAGAKGYQAELTSVVKHSIPGVKPIEVIGYVGITKPKQPKISKPLKF